jgi:SAM-dependent methyltransferase
VVVCAKELGDPKAAPVLDVGAGTGRNAIALAQLGHPTDALERIGAFAAQLREAARGLENLDVMQADITTPGLALRRCHYRLVILSEVLSHFSTVDEVRSAISAIAEAMAPGGLLVLNAFLPIGGYVPDRAAREAAYTAISSLFTHDELAFISTDHPFEHVSEESVFEFERANLPSHAWPPTSWYEQWVRGGNVFDTRHGPSPIELRWLVYRRV